jgi:predicted PurR-regulated permease PerM
MKAIDWFKKASPVGRWASAIATLVAVGLVVWLLWAVVYRLFYQGQDLAKAKGNAIVATEQGTAETNIAARPWTRWGSGPEAGTKSTSWFKREGARLMTHGKAKASASMLIGLALLLCAGARQSLPTCPRRASAAGTLTPS